MIKKLAVFGSVLAVVLPLGRMEAARGSEERVLPAGTAVEFAQADSQQKEYRPPPTGEPDRRFSGSTRETDAGGVRIYVLSPKGTGNTTVAKPTLYWVASHPVSKPIRFVLTASGRIDPVLDKWIARGAPAGLNAISLAQLGVALEPGREYLWSVSVVFDPDQPSMNPLAQGRIRYSVPSPGLTAKLAATGIEQRPALYEENGLWYDAVAVLADLTATQPQNPVRRQQWMDLLKQSGLPAAAASEGRR